MKHGRVGGVKLLVLFLPAVALALMTTPAGLSPMGQRVLAILLGAIVLWATEALPSGVTSLLVVAALAMSGGPGGTQEALVGFSDPAVFFLIGVLTIGLAVSRVGLAQRFAKGLLSRSGGRPSVLFSQMLTSFPLLTAILPSATTRTGILVHVYDRALDLAGVPRGAPLAKAVMLALNSVNRLASTILLTGGITPVVAAGLIGGVGWMRWLALMGAPYLLLLVLAAATIYWLHRPAFQTRLPMPVEAPAPVPLTAVQWRTVAVLIGVSALWLTEGLHHLHAAIPAMLAWGALLLPKIGVLTWKEFERELGWANVFVIGSSLSLARGISTSGAGEWIAQTLVSSSPAFATRPALVVALLVVFSAILRLLIPNIGGFLATTIPLAMSIARAAHVNPLVCALVVTIAGDAVLYYPAQSSASLTVYERGHLTAGEIFRFGVIMTIVAAVVISLAVPYWAALGEPLGSN